MSAKVQHSTEITKRFQGYSVKENCSIIENIPPKGVSFSDFICIFGHVIHRILLFIFFATLR